MAMPREDNLRNEIERVECETDSGVGYGLVFDPGGDSEQAAPGGKVSEAPRGRDFSAYNRELNQQIDPDTQERILLVTKAQLQKKLKKDLKAF